MKEHWFFGQEIEKKINLGTPLDEEDNLPGF